MFIYKQWEIFCKKLDSAGINSVTASSLLDTHNDNDSFLVLKHDVETNPSKALELAKIEKKYNHKGTYYVQGYLLKNKKNLLILKKIQSLGHELSYHHDVMDSNNGDLSSAKREFEAYLNLFLQNGFKFKTVCQHGNPIVERFGYNSNRDFFRNPNINEHFKDICDIMVNFKVKANVNYDYISDSGYGWKIIFSPENNDVIDTTDKDIVLKNHKEVLNFITSKKSIVISTHPHRWSKSYLRAKLKQILFFSIKKIAKTLYRIPFLKKIMSRFYYLAKKI